jgi:hypothetical protein
MINEFFEIPLYKHQSSSTEDIEKEFQENQMNVELI